MQPSILGRTELLRVVETQERIIAALIRAHESAVCERIKAENAVERVRMECRDRMRKAGVRLPGRRPKSESPAFSVD